LPPVLQAELEGRAEQLQSLQAAHQQAVQQLAAAQQQLAKKERQHEVAQAKLELRLQGAARKAEQAAAAEQERLQVRGQGFWLGGWACLGVQAAGRSVGRVGARANGKDI